MRDERIKFLTLEQVRNEVRKFADQGVRVVYHISDNDPEIYENIVSETHWISEKWGSDWELAEDSTPLTNEKKGYLHELLRRLEEDSDPITLGSILERISVEIHVLYEFMEAVDDEDISSTVSVDELRALSKALSSAFDVMRCDRCGVLTVCGHGAFVGEADEDDLDHDFVCDDCLKK